MIKSAVMGIFVQLPCFAKLIGCASQNRVLIFVLRKAKRNKKSAIVFQMARNRQGNRYVRYYGQLKGF